MSHLWDIVDPWMMDNWFNSGRSNNMGQSFHPLELKRARPAKHPWYNPMVGYQRNWHLNDSSCQNCTSDGQTKQLSVTNDKDGFQVCVDVHQFAPKEITVKTSGHSVVIEGKHEERPDEHGFISRHFVRRYNLPETHDVNSVISTLSSDGVLTVKAPLKNSALKGAEKEIQIQHTGPAHLSIKSTDAASNTSNGSEQQKK